MLGNCLALDYSRKHMGYSSCLSGVFGLSRKAIKQVTAMLYIEIRSSWVVNTPCSRNLHQTGECNE